MAELAMKYSTAASRAITDTTLKKPIKEVNRMLEGIRVLCSTDSSNKISTQIWRIDPNSNSIICDRPHSVRLYLCAPYTKYLDVSTITKIKDVDDSNSVVIMTYLDPSLSKNVVMNLSFQDEDTCICFLKVIGYLISKARLDDAHHRQFEYLCRMFNRLDSNNNGFLSIDELDKLYSKLKIHKKEKLFHYLFEKIQKESPKGMNTSEFILFHNHLYSLPDVELIFCTYAFSNGSINIHQFTRFLRNEQYELDATPKHAQRLLQNLEVNENALIGLEFTINGFINYIFDPIANGVRNLAFLASPHQPMDRPLHNYFVKSCYITASNAAEVYQNYLAALRQGYRHFELDIYLSQDSHTLFVSTSRESSALIEISQLFRLFDDEADLTYAPLILTMKLHLKTPESLSILTNTLLSVLKKNRLIFFDERLSTMPKLSDLAKRILIRSSIAYAQMIESQLDSPLMSNTNNSNFNNNNNNNNFVSSNTGGELRFSRLIALDDVNLSRFGNDGSQILNETLAAFGGTNINNNADMTYSNAKASINLPNMPNTNSPLSSTMMPMPGKEKWNHTITFQADRFANMCDSYSDFALATTSSYFIAVSPRNSFQSAAPTLFWNYGVHSVFQPFPRHDICSQLNDAFFQFNADCGYCLKPNDLYESVVQKQQHHLQQQQQQQDDKTINNNEIQQQQQQQVDNLSFSTLLTAGSAAAAANSNSILTTGRPREMINVKISVICGRFMPSLDIKPFVYLELYGPMPMYGATDVCESARTAFKINPRYNNEFNFELPKSVYKQTFVVFSLWDNKALTEQRHENQILGRFAVHIANLRQGFRNVILLDENGVSTSPTSILVHIRKTRSQDYLYYNNINNNTIMTMMDSSVNMMSANNVNNSSTNNNNNANFVGGTSTMS